MTDRLDFRPVTSANVDEFVRFFSAPGAPKHCWCMVWRRTAAEAKLQAPADRKRMMLERIGAGTPVGLLAYRGDEPVGWVSIAPRDTHRALGGPPPQPGEVIWSLVCFYVPRRLRGRGLVRKLLAGAVDHARANGATIVEAYPVDPNSPSFRFMGFVPVFAEAGFDALGMTGTRRHVMQLKLA
jgi:RimJ/RimL family protein N-acetyltransferase